MADLATFSKQSTIGVVALNNPPVNALSHAARVALHEAFTAALDDASVEAILLWCEGRTFVAGADIREFDGPPLHPDVPDTIEFVASSSKPVVAALHGMALGGGVELALACDYRVCAPGAKLGLPEVGLGILPGAGGTQRLPRLIGVPAALEMIVSGTPVTAAKAQSLGLVDEIIEGDLQVGAVAFAARIIADGKPLRKLGAERLQFDDAEFFDNYASQVAESTRGFLAPGRCVQAVRAAVELPFEQGLRRERELFKELVDSPESKAQRHAFFGERDVARPPRLPRDAEARPIRSIAVVGTEEHIKRFIELRAAGLLTEDATQASLVLIGLPTAAEAGEELSQLASICPADTVFAIAGTSVNINHAGLASGRASDVLAMHASASGKLLEIVCGERTSDAACATLLKLAKQLGTVPVVEYASAGSAGARMRQAYRRQAEILVAAGTSPEMVDQAMKNFGFPKGLLVADRETSGTPSAHDAGDQEVVDRCLYALLDEGTRLLDEGVLTRALEVDMVCLHGLGFPVYRGGPMFYADQIGFAALRQRVLGYHQQRDIEPPSPEGPLERFAAAGGQFYE